MFLNVCCVEQIGHPLGTSDVYFIELKGVSVLSGPSLIPSAFTKAASGL